jgi:transposase
MGQARLSAWLRKRHVRSADQVAAAAIQAASAQLTELPGQDLAATIIAELASNILALDVRLKELEAQIAAAFRAHLQAASIESMPGFGPVLGAMLLVAMGDRRCHRDAGHLAAAAGLAPVPKDSGRRVGNLHRPRRYSRPLRHAFYLSAQSAMTHPGPNRDYYLKKRQAGSTHTQAVIALARRRVDVLWALMRDGRTFTTEPPRWQSQAA